MSMMVNLPAEPPRQPSTLLPPPIAAESWLEVEEDDWEAEDDGDAEDGDCAEGSLLGD